jgi:hypothetical protein
MDSIKTRELAGLARLSDQARLGKQAVALKTARDWKAIFAPNPLRVSVVAERAEKPHRGEGAKAFSQRGTTPLAMIQ